MKALLSIAASVQQGGKNVTFEQIQAARLHGATDIELHDTVLIAALFCLFNRYLDGLGVVSTDTVSTLQERASLLATEGYGGNSQ
jgi:alkylhydroperoxidase/carboxymuconolactone decarboxylase family protein YurZ